MRVRATGPPLSRRAHTRSRPWAPPSRATHSPPIPAKVKRRASRLGIRSLRPGLDPAPSLDGCISRVDTAVTKRRGTSRHRRVPPLSIPSGSHHARTNSLPSPARHVRPSRHQSATSRADRKRLRPSSHAPPASSQLAERQRSSTRRSVLSWERGKSLRPAPQFPTEAERCPLAQTLPSCCRS